MTGFVCAGRGEEGEKREKSTRVLHNLVFVLENTIEPESPLCFKAHVWADI